MLLLLLIVNPALFVKQRESVRDVLKDRLELICKLNVVLQNDVAQRVLVNQAALGELAPKGQIGSVRTREHPLANQSHCPGTTF